MATKPAPKTPKTPRCRKVAANEPIKPLTREEYEKLQELIKEASSHNHGQADQAYRVQCLREELAQQEARLAEVRSHNQRIHTAMAPLLHRLPA